MCTTPAPPSTAFVAASIWSGTGEVNTSPGHAASSIPAPTKPPWSGSCPDPPPETSPTLPATGASLRTTICASALYVSTSPCAAASPASDSLTTASGSLTSFFIVFTAIAIASLSLLSVRRRDAVGGHGVGVGYGFLDRPHDLARLGDLVVDERRDRCSGKTRKDVDGNQLVPVRGAASDRRDELGPERTRRVERRAGERADDHDDRDDRAADDDAGEVTR